MAAEPLSFLPLPPGEAGVRAARFFEVLRRAGNSSPLSFFAERPYRPPDDGGPNRLMHALVPHKIVAMRKVDRKNMNVAVVGFGSIGRRHYDNLGRLGVGRRIIVRRSAGANPAFEPPGDALVVHSIEDSIAAGIDLAIVCNPTSLHLAAARQYLAAGVPVLVEKPLSADLAEAERFAIEVASGALAAGMPYCLRYHPAYALAHEHIRQGVLGRVQLAQARFESYLPDWHPWEDYRQSYAARRDLGGGVLPTIDHEIDFVCWCLGTPKSAAGVLSRSGLLDADIDDTAKLTLQYEQYAADLVLSIAQRERRRGFEFVGSKATLIFSFEQQLLRLLNHERHTEQTLWHQPDYDINLMYLALLDDALKAVAAGQPLPIPISAGLDALRVAAAAR